MSYFRVSDLFIVYIDFQIYLDLLWIKFGKFGKIFNQGGPNKVRRDKNLKINERGWRLFGTREDVYTKDIYVIQIHERKYTSGNMNMNI